MSNQKASEYLQLLEHNYIVQTFVDADHCDGLPDYLSGKTRLDIGLNTPIPIRSLSVTEKGISADLSFNRVAYDVFVPWSAVLGVYAESMGPVPSPPKLKSVPPPDSGSVVRVDFKNRKRLPL